MRDRSRATTTQAARDEALRLQPHRVREILRAAADRIEQMTPDATMSSDVRFREIQVSTWDHHGIYNSVAVGQDIVATLTAVQHLVLTGTRAEYAAQLRLYLGISPAAAARAYQQGLAAARRGPLPSTGETRTQLGSARSAGNAAATAR
ncbi:hypothetical protein ABZ069_34140 [Streptomyces microflavus]|uniref:hypothetical protein n=1 Tax=Streptomyces microflavus TaxID=1919 RepID=UPI00339E3517